MSTSRTTDQSAQRINPWKRFYGVFLPLWLLERTELTLTAKVLYAQLATLAGRKGFCWPSQEWLGKRLGVSDRQVRTYLAELTAVRLIEIAQRGRGYGGIGRSAAYWFLKHRWMHDSENYARKATSGHNALPGSGTSGQKPPASKGRVRAALVGSKKKEVDSPPKRPAGRAEVNGRSHSDLETQNPGGSAGSLVAGLVAAKRMPSMPGLPDGRAKRGR